MLNAINMVSAIKKDALTEEVVMTKKELIKKVAQLESVNDHLLTELGYVDHLMRLVGFAGGLETVKLTAQELYESEKEDSLDSNE